MTSKQQPVSGERTPTPQRGTGLDLVFGTAVASEVEELVALVQSAYRGEASRAGWTTEADLIDGQRIDAQMLLDLIAEPRACVLTARADGELVACCELRHKGKGIGYLGMFAVSPTLQAGGVGRRVLAEGERRAVADWGVSRMEMTVLDARTELIAWYRRRGYEPTGETGEFPYGDDRFGSPKRPDLSFVVISKEIGAQPASA